MLVSNLNLNSIIRIIDSTYYRPLKKKDLKELSGIKNISLAKSQNIRLVGILIDNTKVSQNIKVLLKEYYVYTSFRNKKGKLEVLNKLKETHEWKRYIKN